MRCEATRKFNIAAISTKNSSSQSSGLILRTVPPGVEVPTLKLTQQQFQAASFPVSFSIFESRAENYQITVVTAPTRLLLRTGMRLIVNLKNVLHGKLRIALRCGQTLVAEQFLNCAQVGAFFQHVRAEGV